MASKFPEDGEEKAELRTRTGHDMTWSCGKHSATIKFYCKKHTIYICHLCAIKDHRQEQCELVDIEDVILDMRKKLDYKVQDIEETKKLLKRHESEIQSSATDASNHLQSVNDEVSVLYEGKLKSVYEKDQETIRLINEKADEDIRIINEQRDERIKACKKEAKKQPQILEGIKAQCMSEIKTIKEVVAQTTEGLKIKNRGAISVMDDMDSQITRIKQNDEALMTKGPHVLTSLDSTSANVHQEVADCLDRIQRTVQRVKFVEGKVGGEHYGRIDGFFGKWKLVKSFDNPTTIDRVCGLISYDEIGLWLSNDLDLHAMNIETEHTYKIIQGSGIIHGSSITSCAPVDSNVIVCLVSAGRRMNYTDGYSVGSRIILYDRQLNVNKDITMPKNEPCSAVDVDRKGMIVAAQHFHSNIYVINPADGKTVQTITMKSKWVWGGIQALSSGDIVVHTGGNEFTVISRSGEEKVVIQWKEWDEPLCYVDKLTDTLYITYRDKEGRYAVDQVSCDGNIQARRIVEYVISDRSANKSVCLLTPSGNLVACDGNKFFVYRKSLIV